MTLAEIRALAESKAECRKKLSYCPQQIEHDLARACLALCAVIESQWEHRCSDDVGGCTAVSASALAALTKEA